MAVDEVVVDHVGEEFEEVFVALSPGEVYFSFVVIVVVFDFVFNVLDEFGLDCFSVVVEAFNDEVFDVYFGFFGLD